MKLETIGKHLALISLCSIFLLSAQAKTVVAQQNHNEVPLPQYHPAELEGSKLSSVGSDSMDGLVSLWVEEYRKHQPEVSVQIVSRGSAMAPAALIEGTADLGPMARPMKTAEREDFIGKYGFAPTEIRTALAAVGIYVHKDNPLSALSLEQIAALYSAEVEKRGVEGEQKQLRPKTWGALGVEGELSGEDIVLLGRQSDSYVSFYFKQRVLRQRAFAPEMMTTADRGSMFESIALNPKAIGFAEFDAKPDDSVKLLAVLPAEGESAVFPTYETIVDESYPIARYLNIYLVRSPGEPVDPALADFLRFVLSVEGQKLVRNQGMLPLTGEIVRRELEKLR